MSTNRYVPVSRIRPAVRRLARRYGSITQASLATGIPYNTLQSIVQPGRLSQVTRMTAERVMAMDQNPPKVVIPDTWNRKFIRIEEVYPAVISLEGHYGSITQASEATGIPESSFYNVKGRYKHGMARVLAHRIIEAAANPPQVPTLTAWDKKFVRFERVVPLLAYLVRVYGSLGAVSKLLGIPYPTVRGISTGKHRGVRRDVATKIVEAVQAIRHGDRTWSVYENEESPRLATQEEQQLPKNFSRWRSVGGKVSG